MPAMKALFWCLQSRHTTRHNAASKYVMHGFGSFCAPLARTPKASGGIPNLAYLSQGFEPVMCRSFSFMPQIKGKLVIVRLPPQVRSLPSKGSELGGSCSKGACWKSLKTTATWSLFQCRHAGSTSTLWERMPWRRLGPGSATFSFDIVSVNFRLN